MIRPIHGGNLDWAVTVANCPISQIIDFSASINPLGPPQSAIEAINQGLSQLTNYPDPSYSKFKQAIALHHNISPQWVLPSNGAAELLTWVAWEIKETNLQGVLIPSPCFADYKRALNTFNIQPSFYKLSTLEEGSLHFDSEKWAILINNPHNPTGKLWTREMLESYLHRFALVIIDEAFMDFVLPEEDESLLHFVEKYENLIILRSLTKFYSLPALRIGYGVTTADRVARWQSWRDPWSVNTLAVVAGCAVLDDREFVQKTWQWLPKARQELFEGLNKISGLEVFPSSVNFLLVKTAVPSPDLQAMLLKNDHILIRDCISFPELGGDYFRVAVKSVSDNLKLVKAIERIFTNFND